MAPWPQWWLDLRPFPKRPAQSDPSGSAAARQRQQRRAARGRSSEALARAFLVAHGYEIEAANVRFAVGELDLVARQGRTLCIVEVRSQATGRFGPAVGSILARKRRHLVLAAQRYLQGRRIPWDGEVRFDVVTVDYSPTGRPDVRLIQGAFSADE